MDWVRDLKRPVDGVAVAVGLTHQAGAKQRTGEPAQSWPELDRRQ